MTSPSEWIKSQLEGSGLRGKVIYNEDEDSHQIEAGGMAIGLYPLWQDYEGKRIKIKIERLEP